MPSLDFLLGRKPKPKIQTEAEMKAAFASLRDG